MSKKITIHPGTSASLNENSINTSNQTVVEILDKEDIKTIESNNKNILKQIQLIENSLKCINDTINDRLDKNNVENFFWKGIITKLF